MTGEGHICSRGGKVLFEKHTLIGGEFPKLFSFTKFPANQVTGDYELNAKGEPILIRKAGNKLFDRQGKQVNASGYFCNDAGSITDSTGVVLFTKALLGPNGELP